MNISSLSNQSSYSLIANNYADAQLKNTEAKNTGSLSDFLSPETENKLKNNYQDKVNETTDVIATKKQNLREFEVAKVAVENKKSVINAYTLSASGEALYQENTTSSLTETYGELRNEYLQAKYSQVLSNKLPSKPTPIEPIGTLPIDNIEKNKVSTYQSVQKPMDNSLLHLVA